MGMTIPKKYKKNPRPRSFEIENPSSHEARYHRSREVYEEIEDFEKRNFSYEPSAFGGKYRENFDLNQQNYDL